MKELQLYLESQFISYELIDEFVIKIGEKTFRLLEPTDGVLFNRDFTLLLDKKDFEEYDNVVYYFGGRWYYTPVADYKKPRLYDLKYIGENTSLFPTNVFLGIHSNYEILNGTGSFEEWVRKAKFLGTKHLGICEKNSLAGVLKFQITCLENDIHPIIGASYVVASKTGVDRYQIKLYVENEEGWRNLLFINKIVNVINQGFIEESDLFEHLEGLWVVLNTRDLKFENAPLRRLQNRGVNFFYQLDTTEFEDDQYDKNLLLNLKSYIDSNLKPIAITDAYYIDKEDADLKPKLNSISDTREFKSEFQYFKTKEEYYYELQSIIGEKKLDILFSQALQNESLLAESCTFLISQKGKHLPVYFMTDEEKRRFSSNTELFWHLIEKGLSERVKTDDIDKYIDRVETEVRVIEMGGFIDYFLILWDIIRWSNDNDILTGLGRGSAAGSLVSYLLYITHLDPFQFDLLFERFLNEGRVGVKKKQEYFIVNDSEEYIKGTLVKVVRKGRELFLPVEELQIGDEIKNKSR